MSSGTTSGCRPHSCCLTEFRRGGQVYFVHNVVESIEKTAQVADPQLRALLQEQAALQVQIDGLKLKKEVIPAAEYDAQMEKLLTEMALKARAIREKEAKK